MGASFNIASCLLLLLTALLVSVAYGTNTTNTTNTTNAINATSATNATDETITTNGTKFFPRIVGGKKASDDVLSHLVKLDISDGSGDSGICTGSVLDSTHILTAAHCVYEGGPTFSFEDSYAHIAQLEFSPDDATEYYFNRVWIPSRYYNSEEAGFDIAVIELDTEIDGEDYESVTLGDEPEPDRRAIVAGYGIKKTDGDFPNFALQTRVISRSFDDCKDEDEFADQSILRKRYLVCAVSVGYPDKGKTDSCQGDSGGPLFYREDGDLIQYGITAFSYYDCAEKGGIPWYVRASAFKSQIEALLEDGSHSRWTEL